jgi:transglutaminase-like putative cysteine protease
VGPTLAFAALAATGLAVTGRPPVRDRHALPAPTRAALRARAAAGAAAGTVVVAALAVLLGPWVAGRVATTPVDPRRYVQPPQVDSLDESPLVRISGWALNPDQRLFDVTTRVTAAPGDEPGPGGLGTGGVDPADAGPDEAGTGPDEAGTGPGTADPADTDGGGADPADADPADARPQGAGPGSVRVRLAVLPDYDGVTWRVGATYRGAGRVLPQPPVAEGVRVDTVEQEITVADLTGRLLPAVPTPHTVHGARVAYDPGTGTLIRPEGLTAGLRYTVTSARERPDLNLLPAADVPAGAAVARFLRLGDGVPEPLQRLAGQLAEENGAPYERAAAIEQFLGEHYRLVADAPSGHAYPNLTFFLFGPRQGGGQRGTSEQFAASFAVLGRLMGLPTRVVVGFRAPTGGAAVRGADAYAWPEVLFEDLGWVAFDPLPRPDTRPRPVEEDFKPEPENSSAPSEAPTPTAGPTEPAVQPAAAAPARGRGTAALGAGLAATVPLAVAGGAAAVVVLRRAQRRRRLDTGDPAHRIAGAWLEVTDALRLAGRPASRHLAATEVAAHAVAAAGQPPVGAPVRLPVPPIDDLAALVNTSTFAPGATDEAQARRAAAQAVAFASELRARRRWWQRVWWTVHPGPLRWHRRR